MKSVIALVAALIVSACAGVSRPSSPEGIYDFGLPPDRLASGERWSKLALDVSSPPWFDSLNIDYRLAYDNPLKRREYASSRWAGAPAAMLSQRLRQQLGMMNSAGAAYDCLVRVELQEFSQVFDSPQLSRGVLRGRITLIGARRYVVSEKPVLIVRPAPTADAGGGVSALVAASEELSRQLLEWLGGLEKSAALKTCRLTHESETK